MKAVSSSNVIKHIASSEGNWNLPLLNVKNRGADPTKPNTKNIDLLKSKLVMSPVQNSSSLLTPKSDWHLISSYSISPESHIKVRRIKEMITTDRAHDC